MAAGDEYRAKAAELESKAKTETREQARMEMENLAKGYRRLARQAEQNAALDLVYATPIKPQDTA